MNRTLDTTTCENLLSRIRGEYLEMPGLRLKREQAQRLWGLERDSCVELLALLVEAGFLQQFPDGTFGRSTDTLLRSARTAGRATYIGPSARTQKKSSAA